MSAEELQKIISPKFTEQVLLDIVAKKTGLCDIKLKKIQLGAPAKKGDSYLSTICRFTLEAVGKNKDGKEEFVSFPVIAKFPPKNLARRKTWRSTEFFENEIIFYNKVWSAFQKYQEDAQIKDKFDNLPLMLATYWDGVDDFVAMVDVSPEGYTSAERATGLDYDHTAGILKILAQFHALSLAFKEQQPENFEKAATSLKETYFSERLRPWYSNFQKNVFVVNRDAVEKELPPEYLHKLNKLIDNDLYGVLIKSCVARGPLSVVTHGDVWVPNFLFKYQGSKPGRITVIDFQLARYSSLTTDLLFFLFSCVDPDLVKDKWDDLIALYHQTLLESMKKYGAKGTVTLDALQAEIKKYSCLGVGMSMEALIMSQLEDDEVSDVDGIEGDEAVPLESVWIIKPFKEKERRQRIAKMVKMAADWNFI
ncbi:hypothetical protein Zmor_010009 [Zophobas morio]|uniref:CHK kinase-like domain-containing protein n=1 Tax=Zophobas morio TaxID=2755281 RepID=A0AA38IPX3_9CUCU|nr:hypothetical protein Zmor_010009 [Zophobas morio]